MKEFRFYLALGVRFFAFVLELPSMTLYTLSDIIKNKEDEFTF